MCARAESATMPEVEVTEEQYEYLESLREEITEELVGPYGHARLADAMQYLIDTHDGEVDSAMLDGGSARGVEFEDEDATGTADVEADEDTGDTEANADADETSTTDEDDDDSDEAKLNSMMQLLDEYDDVWEKAGNDAGYKVKLPGETTETVKTKDDVRALLFKHYQ